MNDCQILNEIEDNLKILNKLLSREDFIYFYTYDYLPKRVELLKTMDTCLDIFGDNYFKQNNDFEFLLSYYKWNFEIARESTHYYKDKSTKDELKYGLLFTANDMSGSILIDIILTTMNSFNEFCVKKIKTEIGGN